MKILIIKYNGKLELIDSLDKYANGKVCEDKAGLVRMITVAIPDKKRKFLLKVHDQLPLSAYEELQKEIRSAGFVNVRYERVSY